MDQAPTQAFLNPKPPLLKSRAAPCNATDTAGCCRCELWLSKWKCDVRVKCTLDFEDLFPKKLQENLVAIFMPSHVAGTTEASGTAV